MFWDRCVGSVFRKSIKCVMNYEVEMKEEQNVYEANLFFGHFSKVVTFQLSMDLKRGRGTATVVFVFHLSGKVSRLYSFVYFHCNIDFHLLLC